MGVRKQAKHERLARSQEVFDRYEAEDILETVFLRKGLRRGVLTIKTTTMEWNVFADPQLSQHIEWNDPDCFPEYAANRQQFPSPLHFLSMLIERGWQSAED